MCNVCLCRIIMNACNNNNFICTLHRFTWYKKKLDKIWGENRLPIVTIEGKKGRSALLRLLINDYVKGSGTTHLTQLHKTFTHTKKVEKERQQKKAKSASIKQRKAKACTKLSDNLYSATAEEAHKLIQDFETRNTVKFSFDKASKGFRGTGE